MNGTAALHEPDDSTGGRIPVAEHFPSFLERNGLKLTRGPAQVLQINMGFLCNQACAHCHLEAGPDRSEVMGAGTVLDVVDFAARCRFRVIDITGGAPELNPNLADLIERMAPLAPRIMLRSNLTALADGRRDDLIDLCRKHSVVIVASFPSLNRNQTESLRGEGVFEKSIETLRKFNSLGYGRPGSNLEIDLASNAAGAFLLPPQDRLEKKFRDDLERKWGIVFNRLYAFTNVPLGRFRRWLKSSDNYDRYLQRLASSFNARTLENLMCRTLLSVSWDGYLFDCDFNQVGRLFMGGRKTHISQLETPPQPGSAIALGDHCYACTAGAGFSCGGALDGKRAGA